MIFSNQWTHISYFITPKFESIFCLNWNEKLWFINKVIFYIKVQVHKEIEVWLSSKKRIVSNFQLQKYQIVSANKWTYLIYFIHPKVNSICSTHCENYYYSYSSFSNQKITIIPSYHSLYITADYPLFSSWPKWRACHYIHQPMNPYQFLYYSQFDLIWYINCNFKLLFKNKGIFLLKYRGTSKSKLGSHRKVQWYESYNSKNSAFLTLIKETSLVISLRSSYIIYAVIDRLWYDGRLVPDTIVGIRIVFTMGTAYIM